MTRMAMVIASSLLIGALTHAHPGVGIVMDSKGNVYYTDLKHVWMISPDGKKSIVVRNVHTHELMVDADDNLYGEHLWYEGDATGKWGHRVWRRSPDGTVADIIPARRGFLHDYNDFHFVRDRSGNMYWADRGDTSHVRTRSHEGVVTTLVSAPFRNIRWMTVSPAGTVYLVDLHDLVQILPNGTVRTVARNLAERRRSFVLFTDQHAIMGLWADARDNVYAAVMADREVKRISPDGRVEVVARSGLPYSPTGGLVAPNGDLWILEYADPLAVRVRRINADGSGEHTF
jgi:ribosomal protein L32E